MNVKIVQNIERKYNRYVRKFETLNVTNRKTQDLNKYLKHKDERKINFLRGKI